MSNKSKLSDFISIKHGFAFKGEFISTEENENCLLTPGNFAIGGGFKSDKFKFYTGDVPSDYILNSDDLIVTMTDLSKDADTLGYSALVPNIQNKQMLHNQRIGLVIFINDELDKEYLYFLMRSKEYRHHVVSTATGSTVKHTSPSKILSFEFDKPTLEQQKKIAKYLLSFENKIQLNTQTNQTLEQIAQAIFKSWFVDFDPVKAKIDALANGGTHTDAERAAMQVISGKTNAELTQMQQTNPDAYKTLEKTAALFPSEMVESELGDVPKGWGYCKVGDVVDRLKNPQKLKKDDISADYSVPVFEQGSNILMGYTQVAGFEADIENPMFIFGDHTCVTHLSTTPFSSYQNVITLKGFNLSTYWVYWAVRDKQKFQEYRRHWMEFIVKDIIVPDNKLLCDKFSERVKYFHKKIDENTKENQTLSEIRDSLLPRLLSGDLG
ncbi:restriction endonuclease subunit S [Pasteurella sp. PK-2025]|uniref:restriction endonuclease subunit S n=1 Tax=Pasteurella sp. PK-2025 TaxID=3413133 RepID=UPI003C75E586